MNTLSVQLLSVPAKCSHQDTVNFVKSLFYLFSCLKVHGFVSLFC